MPNGHDDRAEDERELIRSVEEDGWNYYPDPDDWIQNNARSDGIHRSAGFQGPREEYHGNNYVYLAVSSVHNNSVHVFSQKKSDYYEKRDDEWYCPNCQEYIRLLDGDDTLQCHRCGWKDENDDGSSGRFLSRVRGFLGRFRSKSDAPTTPSPYLIEIRLGGETKQHLRDIIYDVADEFDVRGVADPRPVPHVTLFGPYNTNYGRKVKETIVDVLDGYDLVPYRIEGFDHFGEDVIYADVVPSPELRSLRRELSRRLRPLCYNYPDYDADYFYDYHITIAFKDIDGKFDAIWEYVTTEYDLKMEEYALRVSNLRKRDLLWEYDLPQNAVLTRDEAISSESWERTEEALDDLIEPTDHDDLSPEPVYPVRLLGEAKWSVLWIQREIARRW